MSGPSYLTQAGFDKLKEQLDALVKKRKEIARDLEAARSFGDLSENAEYETAKHNQDLNEARIADYTSKLSSARIINHLNLANDKVLIGATVWLKDLKSKAEIKYKLVSETEVDPDSEEVISVTSPIAQGLLGCQVKDTVEIQVPAGMLHYKVLKITR